MWLSEEIGHHDHFIKTLATMPDGRVVSGDEDRHIRIWPMGQGSSMWLEGHRDAITALIPVAGRAALVSGSWDRTLALWDTSTGERIRRFRGHLDRVDKAIVCKENARLLSSDESGVVCEFDLGNDSPVDAWYVHENRVRVLLDTGSSWISAGDDGRVLERRWCDDAPRQLFWWAAPLYSATLADHGRALVAVDAAGRVLVHRQGTGPVVVASDEAYLRVIRLAPDGTTLVCGGKSGKLLFSCLDGDFDAAATAVATRPVFDLAWLNESELAGCGRDGLVFFAGRLADGRWDIHELAAHKDHVFAVTVAGEDAFVTGGIDGKVIAWRRVEY